MLIAKYGSLSLSFVDEWDKLTLRQYNDLSGSTTHFESLKALCSNPELLESLPDPNAEAELMERLPFLRTLPPKFSNWPVPLTLSVEGRIIPIPERIGLETYGQFLAVGDIKTGGIDAIARTLAVYLYPALTGKPYRYQLTDLEEVLPTIYGLYAKEALPLAAFFLGKLTVLQGPGIVTYNRLSPKVTKLRRLKSKFLSWLFMRSTPT